MQEGISRVGIRGPTMDHHSSKRHTDSLNCAFSHAIELMTVAGAELVLYPLTFAMVDPFVGSVNKFIIGANVSCAVGGMLVVCELF